jgi:DNA-binding IclR family transcriptional regulator
MAGHRRGALLSPAAVAVLDAVIRSSEPITQSEVIRATGYSQQRVSSATQDLLREGWLVQGDRRTLAPAPGAVARALDAALRPTGPSPLGRVPAWR